MVKYSARTSWQLRVQRKVGSDYIRLQTTGTRKAMIIAAVAAIHLVLLVGFLNWRGYGHRLDLLVPVKLIPLGHAAAVPAVWHPHAAAGGPARN